MNDQHEDAESSVPAASSAGESAETERRRADRRARLDRIFGEALPEVGTEEAARIRSQERDGGTDDWLRSNVPPHHG